MIQVAVKLGYGTILTSLFHSRNAKIDAPRLGAQLYSSLSYLKCPQRIEIFRYCFERQCLFSLCYSAYKCIKMQSKEWVVGGKIGVRPSILISSFNPANLPGLAIIIAHFFNQTSKIFKLGSGGICGAY